MRFRRGVIVPFGRYGASEGIPHLGPVGTLLCSIHRSWETPTTKISNPTTNQRISDKLADPPVREGVKFGVASSADGQEDLAPLKQIPTTKMSLNHLNPETVVLQECDR